MHARPGRARPGRRARRARATPATMALAAAGAAGAAAAAGAVAWRAIDDARRNRLRRSARVWRLTARRGVHWASVQVRGVRADAERRAALEEQFAIRSAQDVAAELGQMKGALMKLGQLASVIVDGLPEEARAALAQLQADVPPMSPELAASVVREELGGDPTDIFLDWQPVPVAAASIGQVHRAVTRSGDEVAVKVQYPGAAEAIRADLDNADLLYGLAAALAYRGMDTAAIVEELRARMLEELDYRREADNQRRFAQRVAGHPFIGVPAVFDGLCSDRVLTTAWVQGVGFAELEAADDARRQHAAEVVFRFAQGSVHHHREFNGDPHPGNYRFSDDGRVWFLDFGLVKRWDDADFDRLMTVLDPVLERRADELVATMEDVGFLAAGHGLDPARVLACVGAPYAPYQVDRFTFTPSFAVESMRAVGDLGGPYGDVVRSLNLPPSFVVLNRVLWGLSGLLGRLGATNRWRGILDEYRHGAAAVTPLGAAEAAWRGG